MKKSKYLKRVCIFCIISLLLSWTYTIPCFSNNNRIIVSAAPGRKTRTTLNIHNKAIVKNESFRLSIYALKKRQTVSFYSDNPAIASVDSVYRKHCYITGRKVGSTTIRASIKKNGKTVKTLKCKVSVTPLAMSVRFQTSNIKLETGDKYRLLNSLNLKPKNTAELPVFTVSDMAIAKVSKKGILTALSSGEVTVTAKISNGKSDSCTVRIVEKDTNN